MSVLETDISSDWKLSKCFPDVAERWRKVRQEIWDKYGLQIKVSDGMRSFAEQWAIWGQGRLKDKNGQWVVCDKKLIRTHAIPGTSYHQYGLAIDSYFAGGDPYLMKLPPPKAIQIWQNYGQACKDQGFEWGGDWPEPKTDRPHCEMTYGLSIHTIQIIYEDHGLDAVWERCKTGLMCGGEIV